MMITRPMMSSSSVALRRRFTSRARARVPSFRTSLVQPPAKRTRGNGLYIPDAKVGKNGSFGKRRAHKVRTKFDSKGRKKSQEVEVQESQTNGFVCRDRTRGRG